MPTAATCRCGACWPTALEGRSGTHRTRDDEPRAPWSFTAGRRRATRARPRDRGDAVPRGRRGPALRASGTAERASRSSTRTATTSAARAHEPRQSAALVAQVAATGALTRRVPADLRPAQRAPRGLRGPHPADARLAASPMPGELFAAAEAVGRTVELDLACLTTSIAGVRPAAAAGSLTLNLSPRTLEIGRLQRPRPRAAARTATASTRGRVVLELTEREAVEDMDRLRPRGRGLPRRRACASRPMTSAPATPACACSRQLQFDIVKIDLSLVQGGAVRADLARGRAHAQGPRRPLGRAGHRRRHRDARAARVRALARASAPARATCSAGRSERPSTEPVDLDAPGAASGDWLVDRLRSSADVSIRHDRGPVPSARR